MKILLCGNRSFVATGLSEKLVEAGFLVDSFSRGKEERNGFHITGDVYNIASNKFLAGNYDVTINFILLKNCSVDENLLYIKELVKLCKVKSVKNLIHISSIIVYNNSEAVVNENTVIEEHTDKAGYGEIKIEVDRYLQSLNNSTFKISIIRPGYVLTEDQPFPFVKKIPFRFALIKGDKKSILPIVKREDIHQAIVNLLRLDTKEPVYLFAPSENKTKYEYAKERANYHYVLLPKWLILGLTNLFVRLKLLSKSFYTRVEGMYIQTHYDSSKTEKLLNIKF